ncbi:MAG: hypothetical protein FWD82_10870 [Defluviitaleaceae bacterium]|nr:hypothetical protein [Defluviitaleaceae bacterium]
MAKPRRAYITIEYDGKDITQEISESLISFTYNDKSADEADDIAITLHDKHGYWHNDWYPKMTSKGGGSDDNST